MRMKPTLNQLAKAEQEVFLYLNRKKDSPLLNRVKKFLAHPLRYLYHNLCKVGVLPWKNIHAKTFWGSDFLVPLKDVNAATLYFTGTLSVPEISLSRFFIKNIQEGDEFYDVGANLGYYSALASSLGARVHAFEPNPSVLAFVRHNAGGIVNEVALGDAPGKVTLYDTTGGNKSGMSTTLQSVAEANKLKYKEVQVPMTTLDIYAKSNRTPTYIKIDVEGFEEYVLNGARTLLTTTSPIITMEIWDAPQAIEHSRKALQILKELGYVSYRIEKDGEKIAEEIVLGKMGTPSNYCFLKQ